MGARYPFYLLADSPQGQQKQAEVVRAAPSRQPTYGDVRQGFVYEQVPHITLRSIVENAEVDVIWERFQEKMEPIRQAMNARRGLDLEEWQIPREPGDPWPANAEKQHERFVRVTTDATRQEAVGRINKILGREYTIETLPEHPIDPWTDPELLKLHAKWWELRIERQKEIDASIAAKASSEYLYDKPYEDNKVVRVAGPFTVESLSPHRTLGVDENDELIDPMEVRERPDDYAHLPEFGQMVLENLRIAGVQQAHKEDRIEFTSLRGWPGTFIGAEGRYQEGATEKRAGIFIGPEFGTVRRSDLVDAAREAGDANFDVVIACAFNYEPHASEFDKLGRVPVLKARMNADLHMADDLKNTGSGNLFVIFGEPDIDLLEEEDQVRVKINGVDVFDPSTGEVRSDDADGIACWFIDTDYNGESFFVRQAYFLGANDPYKALKTTLKAEIDEDAWASLNSDTSRAFPRPSTGRVAVKVINHLGDEVMKVFRG
jgi:adenine-specific DNA-methyltransferase